MKKTQIPTKHIRQTIRITKEMNTTETNHKNVGSFGGGHVDLEEIVGTNTQSYAKIGIGVMNAPTIPAS